MRKLGMKFIKAESIHFGTSCVTHRLRLTEEVESAFSWVI